MKGRWAAGIVPRNFSWIVKDRLAVSERPGGYAPHHRPVRRQEEILWINAQGFDRVISLLASTHNLRAYEELHLAYADFPVPAHDDVKDVLSELYPALLGWLRKGDRLLVHQEELGERVGGVMAGFLYWSGMFAEPPQAISAIEQLLRRQLGSAGRSIVAQSVELPPPHDEFGVPLPRRSVIVGASLLGVPNTSAARSEGSADSSRSTTSASSSAKKTTPKKIAPKKGASAAKAADHVAAIRPITKAAKTGSTQVAGEKPTPIKTTPIKKSPTESLEKKKKDGSDVASKGTH